jgi:hypothetical protein
MAVQIATFWCSTAEGCQFFGGIFCFHLKVSGRAPYAFPSISYIAQLIIHPTLWEHFYFETSASFL